MCPDWESNQWPFGSQPGAKSTEPHQPGLNLVFFKKTFAQFIYRINILLFGPQSIILCLRCHNVSVLILHADVFRYSKIMLLFDCKITVVCRSRSFITSAVAGSALVGLKISRHTLSHNHHETYGKTMYYLQGNIARSRKERVGGRACLQAWGSFFIRVKSAGLEFCRLTLYWWI